ncbi:MAG: mitochondrial fission ELM1 family protein [Pseudomonadota bacterium]
MNRKASRRGREPQSSTLPIMVLTDGRAGNRAQALGLAEALARRGAARIEERVATLRRPFDLLPATAWHALRALPGWPAAGLRDPDATLAPLGQEALVIGAGRRAAPLVAYLAARDRVACVQLLDPQMDPGAFGIVAAPAHDGFEALNAVATLGSVGRIDRATLASAEGAIPPDLRVTIEALPRPRVGILLGGSSRSARWHAEDEEAFIDACVSLARTGYGLVVTPSRRSDPAVIAALRRRLPAAGHWLWNGDAANPYPGLLGLVDAVLATADSVNMASEAAATGLPVHVFPIRDLGAKHRAFHAALEAHGASRPFDGHIARWTYPPLAEAERLAGIVAERLLDGWPDKG